MSLQQLAPSGRLYQALRKDLQKIVKDIAANPASHTGRYLKRLLRS